MSEIPRHLLPQIPFDKLPKFAKFMKKNGVRIGVVALPTDQLKPIQKSVNRNKIDSLKMDKKLIRKPLLVTEDGFIVDGHHRWIALKENGVEMVPCVVCFCGLHKMLKLSHLFDDSYTKTVHESTIYSRLMKVIKEEIKFLISK